MSSRETGVRENKYFSTYQDENFLNFCFTFSFEAEKNKREIYGGCTGIEKLNSN
jgi:hypothetical protein